MKYGIRLCKPSRMDDEFLSRWCVDANDNPLIFESQSLALDWLGKQNLYTIYDYTFEIRMIET